jgi:hypothetical protein
MDRLGFDGSRAEDDLRRLGVWCQNKVDTAGQLRLIFLPENK